MSGCQVVLPQLEVGCLRWVAEVNTHGNRHWGLWLQSLWTWKRGEERRKGRVSDKGTVCIALEGWSCKGRGGEAEGGGQQQSGTDRHPQLLCFLLHKARPPCVRNPSFNLIPHTSGLRKKKRNTWRTSIFPKLQACQREHQHQERRGKGDGRSGRNASSKRELSKAKKRWRGSLDSWLPQEEDGEEEGGGEVKDGKNTDRQKHPPRSPSRPVLLSPWSRAILLYNSF